MDQSLFTKATTSIINHLDREEECVLESHWPASKTILLIVASLIRNFDRLLPNNMNPDEFNMEEELDIIVHVTRYKATLPFSFFLVLVIIFHSK